MNIHRIITTCLLFSFMGFSQNMCIATFKPMLGDMEARLHFEKTPDDDPCIFIKLVTPYEGFDIEVGGAILYKKDESKKAEMFAMSAMRKSKFPLCRGGICEALSAWKIG